MSDGLIGIREAADLVHRKVGTLRRWERRGYTSNGMRFVAARRDEVTGERFFRRSRILEIRAALNAPGNVA